MFENGENVFIEKILLNDPRRDPSLKRKYLYLRFECDECGLIYEKKPGNVSKSKSGLTFCSYKCRGLSCSSKGKGLMKTSTEKTVREIYGVDSVLQSEIVKERIKKSMTEKYGDGITSALHVPGAKEKRKRTHLERYGVEETFQCEQFVEQRANTWLKKYGVPYRPFPDSARKRSQQAMTDQPTKWASKTEIKFRDVLIEKFGSKNVFHQKWVNQWPIDFYVKSIDTYIQFDGVYWHGLDTTIEILSSLKSPRDQARYQKYLTDQKQNLWFAKHRLKLIRITDTQFKNLGKDVISLLD